ncbi:MAG UNVERIFIED_CONTAM: NAD-dependent epimerase/dehydratase family protein [Anaerolineae bacterium]|jgi:nucleoside-diphosphate-sugar epimerase
MMPIRTLESIVYGINSTLWNAETLKRDWTHVADTVAGIVAALNRPMGFMTFNLGVRFAGLVSGVCPHL